MRFWHKQELFLKSLQVNCEKTQFKQSIIFHWNLNAFDINLNLIGVKQLAFQVLDQSFLQISDSF